MNGSGPVLHEKLSQSTTCVGAHLAQATQNLGFRDDDADHVDFDVDFVDDDDDDDDGDDDDDEHDETSRHE